MITVENIKKIILQSFEDLEKIGILENVAQKLSRLHPLQSKGVAVLMFGPRPCNFNQACIFNR